MVEGESEMKTLTLVIMLIMIGLLICRFFYLHLQKPKRLNVLFITTLGDKFLTLAKVLKANGFLTAAFIKGLTSPTDGTGKRRLKKHIT